MGWISNKVQAWKELRSASAQADEASQSYWNAQASGDEEAQAAADVRLDNAVNDANEAGERFAGKFWLKATANR